MLYDPPDSNDSIDFLVEPYDPIEGATDIDFAVEVEETVRSPTGLAVSNIVVNGADLSWVDESDDEDGYRVFLSTDGGSSWTQYGNDLSPDTTSISLTGLEPATEYVAKVVSVLGDAVGTDTHPVAGTLTVTGTKTVEYTELIRK